MNVIKNGVSKKRSELRMLLVKPKNLCDSDSIAKSIASRRWAKEVHITTGEFGFLVSTQENSIGRYDAIKKEISKIASGARIFELTSHSTYRHL